MPIINPQLSTQTGCFLRRQTSVLSIHCNSSMQQECLLQSSQWLSYTLPCCPSYCLSCLPEVNCLSSRCGSSDFFTRFNSVAPLSTLARCIHPNLSSSLWKRSGRVTDLSACAECHQLCGDEVSLNSAGNNIFVPVALVFA